MELPGSCISGFPAQASRLRDCHVSGRSSFLGVPNLVGNAAKVVEDGTYLCLLAIEIADACVKAGIHFSFENPASSMMWDFPPMQALLAQPGVACVTLHYSRYGTDWKKPTIFMSNDPALGQLGLRCNHTTPHQILRGFSPDGTLWTKIACPCPEKLCQRYAELVTPRAPRRARTAAGSATPTPNAVKEQAPLLGENWLNPRRWHLVYRGRWLHEEHNNLREARTAAGMMRHLSRDPGAWGQRVLAFTDSLVGLGILTKGRSSVKPLNHLCRRAAAIALACRIRVAWRWVPSEHNYSDGPSRGEDVGVARDTAAAHRWRGFPRYLVKFLPKAFQRSLERRNFTLLSSTCCCSAASSCRCTPRR